MPDDSYQGVIHTEQGGLREVVPSGGSLDVESGGEIDIESGGALKLAGTQIAATAAELNAAADADSLAADGLVRMGIARATYDFAEHGGAISAIDLGVTLPDNAVVIGGFVDVITTLTSATDAATMAIHVESAGDIVAAIAISDVSNPWDAGLQAIIPKSNTPESTGVKLTQARAITATIAVEAITAGKFIVFLHYVVSD